MILCEKSYVMIIIFFFKCLLQTIFRLKRHFLRFKWRDQVRSVKGNVFSNNFIFKYLLALILKRYVNLIKLFYTPCLGFR